MYLSGRALKKNGLYVHRSPPKLVNTASPAQLRQWLRGGDYLKLERAVLNGQGRKLLSEAGPLPPDHHLPALVERCEGLHRAVERGSLCELRELLNADYNTKKIITCCDENGVGLLHKAVYFDYLDIIEWLVKNYPHLANQRDSLSRTPLHYSVVSREEATVVSLLEGAGASRGARDVDGHTAAYYRGQKPTEIALPTARMPAMSREKKKIPGIQIKRHNIRIWCHDCDMAKLQRVVWDGAGAQLLSEVSNQSVVKRFLEAVPYIMNTIRDIHIAVIQNDLEGLMKHAGDPVAPVILSSRDPNFMTVLHKAAGLGHVAIMKYIANRYPEGINDVDYEGRTALHYAAAVRDDQHTYDTLLNLGAEESIIDNKSRTAVYYQNRYQEIDKNLFKILPEAPRTPSSAYPPSWDWKLLETEVISELNKKSRRRNTKTSSEHTTSSHNTTRTETTTENSIRIKPSSTQEFIKSLPGLDDVRNTHEYNPIQDAAKEINDHVDDSDTMAYAELLTKDNETLEAANADSKFNEGYNENAEDQTFEHDENALNGQDTYLENNETYGLNKTQGSSDTDTKDVKEDENSKDTENHHDDLINLIKTSDLDEKVTKQEEDKNIETQSYEAFSNDDSADVQVPGETQSIYSDINLKSTAEASDEGSSHRGNSSNGRNTQESLLDGFVNEDLEIDSETIVKENEAPNIEEVTADSEIDPEVTEMINNHNMEMLAALVLNGEGARLIGRKSSNVELQSFLENVPTYMKKIKLIHKAAREGNVKDLQSALDRRKFAIARDPISPNGATPLHVATLFGKTNVVKYLGGRFPETLSAVDFEGRTALHYAAILPDNGHYYNLLQQLGANSKDLDDNGTSAEEYLRNPELLSFNLLASEFGINDDYVQNTLTDRIPEDFVSSRRILDIPEDIDTLERCFRLLSSATSCRTPASASSNRAAPPLILKGILKKQLFDNVKTRLTKLDHNLFDVIWPAVKKLSDDRNILQTIEEDCTYGIVAPDYYVYSVFKELLIPLVKDIHNITSHSDLPIHPYSNYENEDSLTYSNNAHPLVELNVDIDSELVLSGTMECMRNISGYELPLNLNVGTLEEVESNLLNVLMKTNFTSSNKKRSSRKKSYDCGGTYYTLIEVLENPSEIRAKLASASLLIPLCDKKNTDDCIRLHGRFWPHGRGVYVSDDVTVAIWVNIHDHLRVIMNTPSDTPGEVGITFSKLSHMMTTLHEQLKFVWDPYLGHLSYRPHFLGSGLHFNLIVQLEQLSQDQENLKQLCSMRGLLYRESLSPKISKISNYRSLSITETDSFNDFATAATNLLRLETELKISANSTYIASMLTNIFKRKRSSLTDHVELVDKKF